MSISWTSKDPDEVDTRQHDFSAFLDEGETVTSYASDRVSGTVTATPRAVAADATTAVFDISGGANGELSVFDITIETSAGRTLNETILLPVVSTSPSDIVTTGYVAPTVANLRAMFPAFATTTGTAISMALTAAEGQVDSSWMEGDFAEARLLYAAHWLTLNGHGTGVAAQVAGLAGVKSMKSGALSVDFADGAKASSSSTLQMTTYGQRFLALLRRNKAGPRVTGGTVAYIPDPITLN